MIRQVDVAGAQPASCVVPPGAHHRIATPTYRGISGHVGLRTGLRMHYCDGVDLADFTAQGEMLPGLVFYFFLRDAPDAQVGGRDLLPSESRTKSRVQAVMMNRTQTELLERHGRPGSHVTKVAVGLTQDWLADSGLDLRGDGLDLDRFSRDHMRCRYWAPAARIAALAEQILHLTPYTEPCRKLHLESRVLDLVAETLAAVTDTAPSGPVRAHDRRRLARVEEFLDGTDTPVPSLEVLAQEAGVSVSTLQRLFHAVHGMSAFEYLRRRALERARIALDDRGLSVKEAAFLAGYSDASNFAKAFRRQFGRLPGRMAG